MYYILVIVTIIFAIARFIVPVEGRIDHADIFKDLAHLYVGFLFGWAAATTYEMKFWKRWGLAIGLTAIEVIAFFIRKD